MATAFEIDILTEQPEFEFGAERRSSKGEADTERTETLFQIVGLHSRRYRQGRGH